MPGAVVNLGPWVVEAPLVGWRDSLGCCNACQKTNAVTAALQVSKLGKIVRINRLWASLHAVQVHAYKMHLYGIV